MRKEWFYDVNGDQVGPVSLRQLEKRAQAGTIGASDLIWRDDFEKWEPARSIKELRFIWSPPSTSGARKNTSDGSTFFSTLSPAVIVAAVSIGVLLIGGACVAIYRLSQPTPSIDEESAAVPMIRENAIDRRAEELHDERDSLRKAIKELEEKKGNLERDARQLEQKKDELNDKIEKLVSKLKFLSEWRKTDFVLISPTHLLVGILDEGNALRVISKTEGALAEAALGVVRNWHIPRIGHDKQLTRQVFNVAVPGHAIPVELADQVRERFWKPQQFVPVPPDRPKEALSFIVYRDLKTYQTRVGYCLKADNTGVDFHPLGEKSERIDYTEMQLGTARRGSVDEVLGSLADVDFLDYCLLRIAQKLGSDKSTVRPSVLVRVEIDIPDDHIRFYESLDENLVEQSQKPVLTEIYGLSGLIGFLADLASRTGIPRRRKALREEMIRTDPHRRARHLSRYVEDEIAARLSKCGLSPIVSTDQELFESTGLLNALDKATAHDATHLLLVTVKNSRSSGDYHLSTRLYREDGGPVWAGEGDRVLDTAGVGNQFHVVSGRPALLHLQEDAYRSVTGQESPPVMPLVGKRTPAQRYSHLIRLESAPDAPQIQYRTLYQKELFSVPLKQTTAVQTIETLADVPPEFMLRYIVSEIAEAVLPSAGRVTHLRNRDATITLGKLHGVKAGDRLRVIRVGKNTNDFLEPSFGVFSASEYLLPTELTVTDAAARRSTVSISETGLTDEWPENVPLAIGDLVITKAQGTCVVAIETPILVPPIPIIITRLGLNNKPLVRQKFEGDARATAERVRELIMNGLIALRIPTVRQSQQGPVTEPGEQRVPTHRLYGTITLSPTLNIAARSAAHAVHRITLNVSPVGSDQVLDKYQFDLTNSLTAVQAGLNR